MLKLFGSFVISPKDIIKKSSIRHSQDAHGGLDSNGGSYCRMEELDNLDGPFRYTKLNCGWEEKASRFKPKLREVLLHKLPHWHCLTRGPSEFGSHYLRLLITLVLLGLWLCLVLKGFPWVLATLPPFQNRCLIPWSFMSQNDRKTNILGKKKTLGGKDNHFGTEGATVKVLEVRYGRIAN
jgi:hypothetical protein